MFKPINHIVKIYVTFSLQNIKKFGKGIEKPRILVICMQLMAWSSQGHICYTNFRFFSSQISFQLTTILMFFLQRFQLTAILPNFKILTFYFCKCTSCNYSKVNLAFLYPFRLFFAFAFAFLSIIFFFLLCFLLEDSFYLFLIRLALT